MGKVPYYTDSEESSACSSVENVKTKTKKRFSILKYTTGNVKKKCAAHSVPEPVSEPERNTNRGRKLRGILKHDRDRESSEEEEDIDVPPARPREQYLVGSVPRAAGRPGRGGGVAILIRKNADVAPLQSLQSQPSNSCTKRRRYLNKLGRKQSY